MKPLLPLAVIAAGTVLGRRGRRAEGGIVTWPTYRKRRKTRVDDYKRQYPDAQVEFDSREARQDYGAKVENTKLALATARQAQALLRERLRAVQPGVQVKIVGGIALGTFFPKAPRRSYDLDLLIEGYDPLLYDLRGNSLVYGREHVGADLGYAIRDASKLVHKRSKLPGHGKADLDVFLLDPASGLLWVYESGYLRRSEKGEFGKNKARDRHGFARGNILAWDDFQRVFMQDARKGLTNRKGYIRTYRVGSPKGGAGTFFGSHLSPDWPGTRERLKRWHRDLPLTGAGVLTLSDGDGLARSEGNAQNAPLGARIWHGLLRPVPALRKLAGFDHWCNIDNADAVAAYTLKSRGIDVVHIQNRTTGRTVSVDMRDHTLAELHAHMLREAAKQPKRCASVGAKGPGK